MTATIPGNRNREITKKVIELETSTGINDAIIVKNIQQYLDLFNQSSYFVKHYY